jgi:hypothetical protein
MGLTPAVAVIRHLLSHADDRRPDPAGTSGAISNLRRSLCATAADEEAATALGAAYGIDDALHGTKGR